MLLKKQTFGTLTILGLLLVGCETLNSPETLNVSAPGSPLKANKGMHPQIAQAFTLLKEAKYSEASSYINQTLQTQPKSVILHLLNAVTYEKLAETGDASSVELAVIGYQNALNIDPFNSFAIIQLGKIKFRDQQFDLAQEHFANALLIKPNDPDLIHEFAAASYYAYDIKTALASIKRAEKLKPNDPLIQRSAAMMYAAVGDFKSAEKHFNLFKAKVGTDPQVEHVANRFNDWQSLYKSGRLILAADKSSSNSSDSSSSDSSSSSSDSAGSGSSDSSSSSSGSSDSSSSSSGSSDSSSSSSGSSDSSSSSSGSSDSSSSSSGSSDSGSKKSKSTDSGSSHSGASDSDSKKPKDSDSDSNASGGSDTGSSSADSEDAGLTVDAPVPEVGETATKEEFARGDIGRNTVSVPVTPGIEGPKGGAAPKEEPLAPKGEEAPDHIIMDCYILQINESARTSKGNNILDNLAVTLNPGALATYKGSMWGSGASPVNPSSSSSDQIVFKPDSGFGVGLDSTGKLVAPGSLNSTSMTLSDMGSISGRIFTAGITWAGLTYSLNIANAADTRTEIVSRPTLMTYLKKESRFFSGVELVNVSNGSYGGNLSRYQVGITLAVTPESLIGDLVTLNIGVESSILQNPNPNLLATIDVSKTRVETTVKVRLGETVMLGGLYERDEVDVQRGFPGLRDLPIIQYFFSNQTTLSDRKSVVILLTPRTVGAVKSAVNRAMTRESIKPHFSELIARNPDWFNPDTNAIKIFSYIAEDPVLYYEFRTGDILPPSWGYDVALNDKLLELSSFLYY